MRSEWKTAALGEIVNFSSGGTPSKKNKEYWNGDIPWISAKTMKEERISSSDLCITHEGLLNGSKLAPKGSILLLTRGSGLFNRVPICLVDKPVAFNQDVKCLQSCSEEVSNKYIFYWLLSQEGYLRAKLDATGIGAGKLDMDLLRNLSVPLPSKREQDLLVSFFDALSDKIMLNRQINDNLSA